jgi:peroxiredoxin
MPLQDALDALKADLDAQMFPAFSEALQRAIDELMMSGLAERALKAGAYLPDFRLRCANGALTSSTALLRAGPIVMAFYPGLWCPFSNLDLAALQSLEPAIRAKGAKLVALSPQIPMMNQTSQRASNLGFPILSDAGGEIAGALGVRWTIPEPVRPLFSQAGADLPTFNGDESWTLPIPSRYVIGCNGIIAYAEISPDPRRRTEPCSLLPVLDGLNRLRP